MVYGQILALLLSVADYFTEGLFAKASQKKMQFISFAAGVSVAYIFLVLLPEIYAGALSIDKQLFLAILFGFAVFHIIEKYIRQNYHGHKLRKEHQVVHSTTSFIYSAIVGFILVKLADINNIDALLLFIPVTLHIVIDSLPRRIAKNAPFRVLSAGSAFFGALIASFISVPIAVLVSLQGLVGGGLLYIVVRESLPRDREGKPMFFITGLLLYTIIIMVLWNLV